MKTDSIVATVATDCKPLSEPLSPHFFVNKYGTLIRREFSPAVQLDDKGRCCGRKAMVYMRPSPYRFCPRCNRQFDFTTGDQVQNWSYKADRGGFYCDVAVNVPVSQRIVASGDAND